MEHEPIVNALTHPESVTNWWAISLLALSWIFREIIGFLVQIKSSEGKEYSSKERSAEINPLLKIHVELLDEQKESLAKISQILDFLSDTMLSMSKDVAILKDRRTKNRDG